jgi:hypothetical protein
MQGTKERPTCLYRITPHKGSQTGVSVQLVTVLTGDHQPNASLVVVATGAVGIGPWLEAGKRLVAGLAMSL